MRDKIRKFGAGNIGIILWDFIFVAIDIFHHKIADAIILLILAMFMLLIGWINVKDNNSVEKHGSNIPTPKIKPPMPDVKLPKDR